MKVKNIQLSINNVSHRWFHESSRWLAINNKSEQAVKALKSVAKFNGRHEEGEKIDIKVRKSCALLHHVSALCEHDELRMPSLFL